MAHPFRRTTNAFLFCVTALSSAALYAAPTPAPAPQFVAPAHRVASTVRAQNYEDALAQAKATGSDIVVFQRGSDWNRLGETLYNNVWLKDDFARALGDGFVLVAVDHAELVGGRAVQGQCSAVQCGITGLSDFQIGNPAPLRLAKLVDDKSPMPTSEIAAVDSKDGETFKPRGDGAWVAQGAIPNQDILTLKIHPAAGGKIIRLDFPTDATLPGKGPGRASNGNFAISEIEAEAGAARKTVKFTAAWASAAEGTWGAWQTIDGISDKPDNCWNPQAHMHVRRTLLLAMADPLPAGVELTVRVICHSQWGQHVPGCVRGAVLPDPTVEADVLAVGQAQLLASKNAKFSWWDTTFCPRIALMDSAGRAISSENKPRVEMTPASMAARVQELRTIRQKRDALWTQAQNATGPARAELLRQSLDLLGIANWPGNENCYAFIHDAIRAADPQDESGAVRWLSFGPLGRDGAPGMEAAGKALAEKRYDDALAEVDKVLADPRNKCLDHDRIQRIMLTKFHIYRNWPDHQDQRFEVQRQIAALDPRTYLGIGAVGYLGMYHRTAVPMITYGWAGTQIKAGLNIWDMRDTAYYLDHAGPYRITLTHAGGKDTVKINRIAIWDGTTLMAQVDPAAPFGPGHNVEATLDLKSFNPTHKLVLRMVLESPSAAADNTGNIGIDPQLVPPTIAATQTAPATDPLSKALSGDLIAFQKLLGDQILAQASGTFPITDSSPVRAALAQEELFRVCTPDKVALVAKREDGVPFLKALLSDTDWLESFLNSGPSDRAGALENLRFLHQYAAEDFTNPIVKKLATAMSLQLGETSSRYRFFDRFKHIQRALQGGLMHVSFETYDVREMRFAIYLPGTARDFQYLLDDRQTTVGDYFGACWAIPYRDPNDYGYSVQGWGYSEPWKHYYGAGLGCRPLAAQRQLGGVCGTLSEYGASAAMAHGVMSVTVGQPGHCAYVIRVGETWGIGNDVFGPYETGFGVPGWDGAGYSVAATLWEPVEAHRTAFMNATRLSWLAQLQLSRTTDKTSRVWAATYEQAIAAQPLNYGTWLQYIQTLEKSTDVSAQTWLSLGKRTAHNFEAYPQAAWALADRCFEKASPTLKPAERIAFLSDCHRDIRQENAPNMVVFPVTGTYDWQADRIGDPANAVQFFGNLLSIHHSKDPQYNWFFGNVMTWGSNRFAGNPATASAYAKTMQAFFSMQGSALDKQFLSNTIAAGIRKASEANDPASYKVWRDMAARMLPALAPENVHLNAQQAAAYPKFRPLTGELLTRDALLQTSSACQFDRPLSYSAILSSGGFGGWFDTNNEEHPWAQVQLPSTSMVSGVLLVNRYEYTPDQEEFKWAAPLQISISEDGKTWTKIGSFEKPDAVFRLDLESHAIRARYVRIERTPAADGTKSNGRFHFRSFLVYGRKLS
jgi:hypothetical protein